MKKKINSKQLQVSNDSNKYNSIEEEEKKDESFQEISPEEKEKQRQENIERVKQRLQAKKEELRNKRTGKFNQKSHNPQLEALKQNPLFANIHNAPAEEIKKAIDMMASKMTNDAKQKKNAKKQINQLLEQLKLQS
jgi:hypothetical protein